MPIEFRCNQCQRLLRVPDANAGAKARCPQCASVQQIPSASPPPESSPDPFANLGSRGGGQPSQPAPQSTPPAANPFDGSSAGPGSPSGSGSAPNPFAEQPQQNPFAENPYQSPYAGGYQSAQQFSAESARSKVMGPAIALIIFGSLGALGSGFGMFAGILAIADGGGDEEDFFAFMFIGFTFLMSLIVIFGAARMMVLKNYGLAITSVIISFLCGLCSWLSIPFSIWALVVLCDSNVKRHFS